MKCLIAYLREAAYSQEQIARINYQLKNAVKFAFLTDLEEGSNKLVDPTVSKLPTKKAQSVPFALQKPDSQSHVDAEQSQPVETVPIEEVTSASSGFMEFGSGSIQDIQVILKKYHLSLGNQQYKISKEIVAYLIPKLAELRKDLTAKMKEIKDLNGDFKTNIGDHIEVTNKLLDKYIASVKFLDEACDPNNKQKEKLKPKHDPYLLKLQLDLQLKRQLLEENYLQEAFINLQSAALELEKIVYSKIQCALQRYSALIDSEARLMVKNLCRELQQGILSRPPAVEWDNFVTHHPTCLMDLKSNDPLPQPRKVSDIVYPNMKSPLAKCIRVGYLLRKTEHSSYFSRSYFVLTTNYLHEFKSSDFFLDNKSFHSRNRTTEHSDITLANDKCTATGSHSSSNGTQDLKLPKRRKGLSSSNLCPVNSLSLNDCSLKESSEITFTLQGYASYRFSEDASSVTALDTTTNLADATNASATTKGKHQRTPSTLSMVSVPKFLKGSSKSKEQKKAKRKSLEVKESSVNSKAGDEQHVEWTFKIYSNSSEPTSEELKNFRKWVQDMKALTSFNSTSERCSFIEEKVFKSRSYNKGEDSRSLKNRMSTTPVNSLPESTTSSSSTSMLNTRKKANHPRPQYIDIPKTANAGADALNSAYRSKVNTPAIDENGNLAIVGETKNNSSQSAISREGGMPPLSPSSPRNGAGNFYSLSTFSPQKISPSGEVPQIAISNHDIEAVIPASACFDDSHKSSRASSVSSISNQRRPFSLSPLKNSPGDSPSCVPLDASANGYFGIPLNCNSESRRGSELSAFENESPLLEEDRDQNLDGSRKSRVGYIPQQSASRVVSNE